MVGLQVDTVGLQEDTVGLQEVIVGDQEDTVGLQEDTVGDQSVTQVSAGLNPVGEHLPRSTSAFPAPVELVYPVT